MNTNPMEVGAVPGVNWEKPVGGCDIQVALDLCDTQNVINETLPDLSPALRRNDSITDYSHVLDDLMAHNEIKMGIGKRKAVIEAPDFAISAFPNRPKYTPLPAFDAPRLITKIA